jgi:RNA polymerase sigma-70 factor (ECF subfamily)
MVRALASKVEVLAQRGPPAAPQEVHLELEAVWQCLMRIHPRKRIVYVLFEVEGLSGREIAEALEIKEATVHTRLHHARRELMRMLEKSR